MELYPPTDVAPRRRGLLLTLLILSLLPPLALLRLSWRRWFHFAIDFGRELYVPWRLSEGDRLFVDVAYFNGPLSPYLNALGFALFGVSFTTLMVMNLVVLAGVTILAYRLLLRLGGEWSALLGTLLFLLLFALADPTGSGNYNYLAPYSHEMTHGILLALAAVLTLLNALESGRRRWWGATGLLLGLVFLTKAEIFVAALAAVTAAIVVSQVGKRPSMRELTATIATLGLAFSFVLVVAWVSLASAIGAGAAWQGILGTWPHVLGTPVLGPPAHGSHVFGAEAVGGRFYRRSMGLLDAGASVLALLRSATIYLVAFVPVLVLSLRRFRAPPSRRLARVGAVVWIAMVMAGVWRFLDPSDLARALPLIVGATVVVSATTLLRDRDRQLGSDIAPALLVASVFALTLLLKILLRARFHHYGFVLAMPATLVLVVILLDRLPCWLSRRGGDGGLQRWAGVAFLVVLAIGYLRPTLAAYRAKELPYGVSQRSGDHSLQRSDAVLVQRALQWLDRNLGENETLTVLPEGVLLNYLLRVPTATPDLSFMPLELSIFGEERILAALARSPPDVVLLLKRNTLEYGYETLGRGYGERLMIWLEQHYEIVERWSEPRLGNADFGVLFLLRRR